MAIQIELPHCENIIIKWLNVNSHINHDQMSVIIIFMNHQFHSEQITNVFITV